MFQEESVFISMIYVYTKCHMPSSNGSSVIAVIQQNKYFARPPCCRLTLYTIHKNTLIKYFSNI